MWSRFSEGVADSQSEVAEVEQTKGTTEDGAEAVVEALGGSVAGTRDEVARDLVLPAFECVAELVEGGQAQRARRPAIP